MEPITAVVSVASTLTQTPDRILRRREVEHRVGLSRSAIYRRIARGAFPQPLDLGGNVRGWRESAINHYIESLPERTA